MAYQENNNPKLGMTLPELVKRPRETTSGTCRSTFFFLKKGKLESPNDSFSKSPGHSSCSRVIRHTSNTKIVCPPKLMAESRAKYCIERCFTPRETELSRVFQLGCNSAWNKKIRGCPGFRCWFQFNLTPWPPPGSEKLIKPRKSKPNIRDANKKPFKIAGSIKIFRTTWLPVGDVDLLSSWPTVDVGHPRRTNLLVRHADSDDLIQI